MSSPHQDYLASLRRTAVEVASGVLDGSLGIVEAVRRLVVLSSELGIENEEPFLSLRGIDSETDTSPVGAVRSQWSEAALAREDAARKAYEDDVRVQVREACELLLRQFRQPSNNRFERPREG